jgi:hypothetical protein
VNNLRTIPPSLAEPEHVVLADSVILHAASPGEVLRALPVATIPRPANNRKRRIGVRPVRAGEPKGMIKRPAALPVIAEVEANTMTGSNHDRLLVAAIFE